MTKTLVVKFGGTSIGSADAIKGVANQVKNARDNWPHVVVVLSAMSGVTDLLLQGAKVAASGDEENVGATAEALLTRHIDAVDGLLSTEIERERARELVHTHVHEFTSLCHAVHVRGEASPRALDAIMSLGERIAVHLLAAQPDLRHPHL